VWQRPRGGDEASRPREFHDHSEAATSCPEPQRFFRVLVGSFLRFVFANSRNCFSLIDLTICLEAPLSDLLERFPRFAASAAPAAICCFFDRAGIQIFRKPGAKWIGRFSARTQWFVAPRLMVPIKSEAFTRFF